MGLTDSSILPAAGGFPLATALADTILGCAHVRLLGMQVGLRTQSLGGMAIGGGDGGAAVAVGQQRGERLLDGKLLMRRGHVLSAASGVKQRQWVRQG